MANAWKRQQTHIYVGLRRQSRSGWPITELKMDNEQEKLEYLKPEIQVIDVSTQEVLGTDTEPPC